MIECAVSENPKTISDRLRKNFTVYLRSGTRKAFMMANLDVRVTPTKKLILLGIDERSLENLVWCAVTYGMNRLFWVDGYLLCMEVYEKSFEHEIENKEIPVSHLCYAELPKYERIYEVGKGMQIPIVNASDMGILKGIMKTVLNMDKKKQKKATTS